MCFAKSDPADVAQIGVSPSPGVEQFFEGDLAFAQNDDICAGVEILVYVGSGLGTADDGLPAELFRFAQNRYDVRPCHEICVDADDRWSSLTQPFAQGCACLEGAVEDFN